eukprot:gene9595-1797_t
MQEVIEIESDTEEETFEHQLEDLIKKNYILNEKESSGLTSKFPETKTEESSPKHSKPLKQLPIKCASKPSSDHKKSKEIPKSPSKTFQPKLLQYQNAYQNTAPIRAVPQILNLPTTFVPFNISLNPSQPLPIQQQLQNNGNFRNRTNQEYPKILTTNIPNRVKISTSKPVIPVNNSTMNNLNQTNSNVQSTSISFQDFLEKHKQLPDIYFIPISEMAKKLLHRELSTEEFKEQYNNIVEQMKQEMKKNNEKKENNEKKNEQTDKSSSLDKENLKEKERKKDTSLPNEPIEIDDEKDLESPKDISEPKMNEETNSNLQELLGKPIISDSDSETDDDLDEEFNRCYQFNHLFDLKLPSYMINSIFEKNENEKLQFLGTEFLDFIINEYLFTSIKFSYSEFLDEVKEMIYSQILKTISKYKLHDLFISDEDNDELSDIEIFYGIIGSVIIENGFKTCKQFLLKNIIPNFDSIIQNSFKDVSSKLFNFNEADEYKINLNSIDEKRLNDLSSVFQLPKIKNRFLLMKALTHSSVDNNMKFDQEIVRQITHYSLHHEYVFFQDRFAFLGKSILNAILSLFFYKKSNESLRSQDIFKNYFHEVFLFDLAKKLDLSKYITHSLQRKIFKRKFETHFANEFIYSIISCIYIDYSFGECVHFFNEILMKHFIEPKNRMKDFSDKLSFKKTVLKSKFINMSVYFENDLLLSQGEGKQELEAENHTIFKFLLLTRILRIEDDLKSNSITKEEIKKKFHLLEKFRPNVQFFTTDSFKEDEFEEKLKRVVFKSDDKNLFFDKSKEENHRKHALESMRKLKLSNNENELKRKRDDDKYDEKRKIIKL